jgi:hypothetical protein
VQRFIERQYLWSAAGRRDEHLIERNEFAAIPFPRILCTSVID